VMRTVDILLVLFASAGILLAVQQHLGA
jgi:hypothetical protein